MLADASPETPLPRADTATFWKLVRGTAAKLRARCSEAVDTHPLSLPPAGPGLRHGLPAVKRDGSANELVDTLQQLTARNQRVDDRVDRLWPVSLTAHATDPRFLQYTDALLIDDESGTAPSHLRARAFLACARDASVYEWLLALHVGAYRLFLSFPSMATASPTITTALLLYLTREAVARKRTRVQADAERRGKRALALRLIAQLSHKQRRGDFTVFTPGVIGAVLDALKRPESRPRHLLIAYRVLLVAPAHGIVTHPLLHNVSTAVARVHNNELLVMAERLVRRVYDPRALDMESALAAAWGDDR